MKNILLTSNTLDFLIRYKSSISNLFIKKGHNVHWSFPAVNLINDNKNIPQKIIPKPIILKSRTGTYALFKFFIEYFKFVNNPIYDLIISHTVYCNIALIFNIFFILRTKKKFVIFVSGLGPCKIRNALSMKILASLYIHLLRIISSKNYVKVITLNIYDFNLIKDFNSVSNIYLLRESGVLKKDLNRFKKRVLNKEHQILKVGFVGRFLLEKGIEDLQIISSISKTLKCNIEFHLLGSIDKNNQSSLKNLDFLEKSNFYYHEMNYQDFFPLIDVLAFPSYREGHPRYILSAMSFGVVPVVYPSPGLTVDVIHEYNGLISQTKDPSSLLSCILKLINNQYLLPKLSYNCNFYASSFPQEKTDNDIYELLIN